MDGLRIRRFKDRALASRRRLVAFAVVAALATISLIGSTAQAATPAATGTSTRCLTQEERFAAQCILVAKLLQAANTPDLSPKDMQLAAPGGVIAATSDNARDVNRWRANPQAWIDAKERVAAGSGLSSKDIASTSKWSPKLSRGVGLAGVLSTGASVAWAVRDDFLMPSLGMQGGAEESFCAREGNIVTDLLGSLGGANCAEWRLKEDYQKLVAGALSELKVCFGDVCRELVGVAVRGNNTQSGYIWWVANPKQLPATHQWGMVFPSGTYSMPSSNRGNDLWGVGFNGYRSLVLGYAGGNNNDTWLYGDSEMAGHPGSMLDALPKLVVKNKATGAIVAESVAKSDDSAEWLTRVDCSDGSSRYAVSESFQQKALGAVAAPEGVTLSGCKPVSSSVGIQKAGTGVPPATGSPSPWHPEPAPGQTGTPKEGTTTVSPPATVPQEVQDWMNNFPQCWDGSCRLTLKKVTESTTEVDCFTVPAECIDWYEESAANPTKYKCYYAGQSRALSDCFVYSRVFDKGKVQDGTGYGDPATGGDPGTGTGTKTNPGAALVAMREPVQNPSGDRQCWPTGWAAFNPFEWVFQPVRCALEWAFVPREAKLVQVQTSIKLAATNSRPGEMVQSISGWADAVNDIDPSGCAGPAVNLNLMGIVYSGHPLSACAEPAATLAWWSKLIIGVSVALAAALAITRYLGLQFGFSGVGRSPGGDT